VRENLCFEEGSQTERKAGHAEASTVSCRRYRLSRSRDRAWRQCGRGAPGPPTIYCGQRNYLGVNGIFIHVVFPAPATNPALLMMVSVYQESAQRYGAPVFYPNT
jgi:hypothetical protein